MNDFKLNRNQLKILAIICMVIDHTAWAFVPTASVQGQIMHFIGRFTGPVMAYLLAEGFQFTKDRKKYAIRLGIFALISWFPFSSFEYGKWCLINNLGVIFSLFLGFLSMWYYEEHKDNWKFKDDLVIGLLCLASVFGDWPIFDVMWPFCLNKFWHNEKNKWTAFWIIDLISIFCFLDFSHITNFIYQLGCIVPGIVLMKCYSGQPGKKSAFSKWGFYVFYPLHLLVLAAIQIYL